MEWLHPAKTPGSCGTPTIAHQARGLAPLSLLPSSLRPHHEPRDRMVALLPRTVWLLFLDAPAALYGSPPRQTRPDRLRRAVRLRDRGGTECAIACTA